MNAVEVYEATVLVIGGDLAGKRVVPIVHDADGYTTSVSGEDIVVNESGLQDVVTKIKNLGQYPFVLSVGGVPASSPKIPTRCTAVSEGRGRADRRLDGPSRGQVRAQGHPGVRHGRQRRLHVHRDDPRRRAMGRERGGEGRRGRTGGGDGLDGLRQSHAVELPARRERRGVGAHHRARSPTSSQHPETARSSTCTCRRTARGWTRRRSSTRASLPPKPIVGETAPAGSTAVRDAMLKLQAAGRPARPHPRVTRHPEGRPHDLYQPGQ